MSRLFCFAGRGQPQLKTNTLGTDAAPKVSGEEGRKDRRTRENAMKKVRYNGHVITVEIRRALGQEVTYDGKLINDRIRVIRNGRTIPTD